MTALLTNPSDGALPAWFAKPLAEGERVGRYLIIRDVDGRRHAIGAGTVSAVTETDDGSLLLLPGGRLIQVPWEMGWVLDWLDGR